MSEIQLRDGATIILRPIRAADRDQLLDGFERLSPESRYRRFLMTVEDLPERIVRSLTEVDHHDHEAVVALDPVSGHGIGVARFVRRPDRPEVAEAAVTVADDWQRRGVGTLLLEALAARARDEGIVTFTGPGSIELEADVPPAGETEQIRRLLRTAIDATPPGAEQQDQ
jgi:GNAT superfamily N-acetyltransferase